MESDKGISIYDGHSETQKIQTNCWDNFQTMAHYLVVNKESKEPTKVHTTANHTNHHPNTSFRFIVIIASTVLMSNQPLPFTAYLQFTTAAIPMPEVYYMMHYYNYLRKHYY